MAIGPGDRLGPYEVTAPLGEGGMGEVFRARDTRLGRSVAIKVIASNATGDPGQRARFAREASAIAALNHPHICTVHDVGTAGEVDYLVLELIDGESLAARLRRGPLPLGEAIDRAVEIARALDTAHAAGIVHRDLKPGNVMLTRSGVKVLDFGLARIARGETDTASTGSGHPTATLTEAGIVMGTLPYMAPEQIEGRAADHRADVFAFGAVLFEMLAGRRAFDAPSGPALMGAILHATPTALTTLRPEVPPALDRIVQTCLAKDPDARFARLHDVALALRFVRDDLQATPGTAVGAPSSPSRRIVLASGLTLAGAAAGFALARRLAPAVTPPASVVYDIPLPAGTGIGPGVALSPDGRWIAVGLQMRDALGNFIRPELWLLEMTTGGWRPVAEHALYPFWSPDSSRVAFASLQPERAIAYVDLQPAGRPIVHGVAPDQPRGGAWLTDGRMILGRTSGSLLVMAAAGGPARELRPLADGEFSWRHPVAIAAGRVASLVLFSTGPGQLRTVDVDRPDGHGVLVPETPNSAVFDRGTVFYDRQGIPVGQSYDADANALIGDPRPIAFDAIGGRTNVGSSQVSAGGGHVAVFNQRGGDGLLEVVDRSGARLRTLLERGVYQSLSLSPDGRRLAVAWQRPGHDGSTLWIVDVETGARQQRTFAFDASWPIWHPDGRRLAFRSLQGFAGNGNLYTVEADGNDTRSVTPWYEAPVSMYPAGWTADGAAVVWTADSPADRAGIYVSRRGTLSPYLERDFVRDAALAPTGHLLAFRSTRSGRDEIYVDTFPTPTAAVRVSVRGGRYPRWRADGRELYFVEGDRVMAVGIDAIPLRAAPPAPLFAVSSGGADPLYAPGPDGQRFFVVTDLTPQQTSIKVTLNWATAGP